VVKTTINIPDDKWKKFSIRVIEEYGGRKKNDVIEELIDKYLEEKWKAKK
jgi:metal-responsive CopG/Arc/MetJ family transcriptional regulator